MKFIRNAALGIVTSLVLALGILSAGAQIVNPSYPGPCGKPQSFTAFGIILGHGTANCTAIAPGTSGQVLTSNGASSAPTYQSVSGTGTVTNVSVVSANGYSGTVANASSTPAITIVPTWTGIGFGNGTSTTTLTIGSGLSLTGSTLSATGGGSGTVNNGTTNQIAYYASTGNAVSGDAQFTDSGTGTVTIGTGGTQGSLVLGSATSGAITITGRSTASHTMALPASAGTTGQPLVHIGGNNTAFQTLGINGGGTGQTTLAANGVVIGEGTSGVNVTGPGTAGQCLTSNGSGADPTFQNCASSGVGSSVLAYMPSVQTGTASLVNTPLASPSLVAGGVYSVTVFYNVNGATSCAFDFGGGTATFTSFLGAYSSYTAVASTAGNIPSATTLISAGGGIYSHITGTFVVNASGTVVVRIQGGTCSLNAGSNIVFTRIA